MNSTAPSSATKPSSRCDLHVHSLRSDGRFEPEEVLARAAAGGLELLALTDHDLPTPLAPGLHRVGGRDVFVVVGSEVSVSLEGREQHLLVYFPNEVPLSFQQFCRAQCVSRAERWRVAVQRLGLTDLPSPDAAANAGDRSLTRYHLAQALVERGHCSSIREAFQLHLGDGAGKVPCCFPTFEEGIAKARAAGGLTSWAHPERDLVDRFAGRLAAAGLQALEGLRPGLTSKERGYFRKVARRHGLVLTGGSDWHGWTDGPIGLWALERRDLDPFFEALAGCAAAASSGSAPPGAASVA